MAVGAEVPAGAGRGAAARHPGGGRPAARGRGAARQPLVVVAERAAWIRVYQENGTVIFESILEKGQTYSPPDGIEAPLIWAGNSGSVYVRVGETLHGPLGSGTKAAKDVVLEPQAIVDALRRWWRTCPR